MYKILCFIAIVGLFLGCNNPTGTNNSNSTPAGMRHITGGTFQMGSIDTVNDWDAQPAHSVTVSSFYIDTTTVTQGDYQTLMGVNPSQNTGNLKRPVECVTWFDAVLYCNARSKRDGQDTVYTFTAIYGVAGDGCDSLSDIAIGYAKNGYRLPTEAEWEYACRAGTTTEYYWGNDTNGMGQNAWSPYNSNQMTQPVATKLPNAWGLYDMSGNVYQWCNDWMGTYSASSQTDPKGALSGLYRVLRGGSWSTYNSNLRSASRNHIYPYYSGDLYGIRCVRK